MTYDFDKYMPLLAETDFQPESFFSGRQAELSLLQNLLLDHTGVPVLLIGPRGIGKTALCQFYARNYRESYWGTTFFSAQSVFGMGALLPFILSRIANDANMEGSSEDTITAHVRSPRDSKNYLLVIDDCHVLHDSELASVLAKLMYLKGLSILLTSLVNLSSSTLLQGEHATFKVVDLATLSEVDIRDMLVKRLLFCGASTSIANHILQQLHQKAVPFSGLSPRFVLELSNMILNGADFDLSLEATREKYFTSVSHLLITSHRGRFVVLPSVQQSHLALVSPGRPLFPSAPYVILRNVRYHWKAQIDEFEELLNDPLTPESVFQAYFEKYPHFLKGIDYCNVVAQPLLERDEAGDLIPDFLLQPIISEYCDVLDLKLPTTEFVVGSKDRKRLSQAIHASIAQVREYRDYFDTPAYREALYQKYGIKAYRPKSMLVIGRRPTEISEEKLRQIMSEVPQYLTVMTYDDLLAKMKVMAELYRV